MCSGGCGGRHKAVYSAHKGGGGAPAATLPPLPGASGMVLLQYVGSEPLPVSWRCVEGRYVWTGKPRYVTARDALELIATCDGNGNKLFEVAT